MSHLLYTHSFSPVHTSSINIAVCGYGKRIFPSLNAVKSNVISSRGHVRVNIYLFMEKEYQDFFRRSYHDHFGAFAGHKNVHLFVMTEIGNRGHDSTEDDRMWQSCTTLPLFLPDVFTNDVGSVIYMDADMLFLAPVDDLWEQFSLMNANQAIGMANHTGLKLTGPSNRKAYASFDARFVDLNHGVILMDLTRLRSFQFTQRLRDIYVKYQPIYQFPNPNLNLLHIYLHLYPEQLFLLDCSWNYRSSHCLNEISYCLSATGQRCTPAAGKRVHLYDE
ncbi:putative Glucoside xylosyltransferase 2 [Hypsibius exemplaris]|uniref:UDP-D-xylose:beta-D-glucoside alpha-1,3-D-xylosyltransferase n=1 Tax=Hypsibius exemplaris TaxID=2072580 RepID=A0A1W0X5S6_HYPEX|nr:putative Glucoside xylosyltransferase 2 [Hypsibius exemplaris]